MTEYNMNILYARARYEGYKRDGLKLSEAEMFDELNFVYGNNGFSETLAKGKLKEYEVDRDKGNYLMALESVLNEE